MTDASKIKVSHLQRAAYVYIRQSTPGQVEHNRESTARQYALAHVPSQPEAQGAEDPEGDLIVTTEQGSSLAYQREGERKKAREGLVWHETSPAIAYFRVSGDW